MQAMLQQIHALIVTTPLNHNIQIFSKVLWRSTEFGSMEYPNLIFSQLGHQLSNDVQCVSVFDEMPLRGIKPHNFTYPYVLNSCTKLGWYGKGKQVHCHIVKHGFETLNDARKVFDDMCVKPIELSNHMISARKLFDDMPKKDVVSWNSMISGYAEVRDLGNARDLFERMPKKDVVSWTWMIGVYANAGDLITARNSFKTMPCKNVVSWNNMISSYTQHGQYEKALDAFVQMQSEACSHSGDLEFGKWTHRAYRGLVPFGTILGTALIDMYAKCGDINRAFALFIKVGKRDVFCWNVMIRSVGIHGRAEDAVKLFSLMLKEGLKLNDFTFTAALFACSHGGLVEEGERIFYAMEKEFGIVPKLEHFGCLIDLLSRNGQVEEALRLVEEALRLVKEMPNKPDIAIWGSLLGVIEKATDLETNESGVYVLLSNTHAAAGQRPEAQSAREKMVEKKIWKNTGRSHVYASNGTPDPENENLLIKMMEKRR
ncbi:pentatricopeptide repeat-containing protein [Pyrus ussuriensis x Pyrus communis]|uniref:Pentatricopeptide repeat-containing protein n=1 Tax=Pyrus ussuriensis x Pyrus communis TaxID=2448454 RepID=A0A5N5F600_9ROSA|nr:pentatricopeptide repeat-containing protein [Pyrus ussuriensis x Pyrus communis]